MPEEAYEMTRSVSGASSSIDNHNEAYDSREEEAQLLDKEDRSSDTDEEDDIEDEEEEWAVIVEENGGEAEQVYEKVNSWII